MERTEVVTCFLLRRGRVLIVRRSAAVGTYPGRWSGVSGYLEEASAEEQGAREIREEAGLEPPAVALLRRGEPLEVPDRALGRLWIVHPLLYRVTPSAEIRLDWENVEARWVWPEEIGDHPTVPGLAEALGRILPPEIDDEAAERLRSIRADRRHGAEELAFWALEALEGAVRRRGTSALRPAARRLLRIRPSMAPIAFAAARVLEEAGRSEDPSAVLSAVTAVREDLRRAGERAAEIAAGRIAAGETLLVHSFSSTVIRSIAAAAPRIRRVHVTESRPDLEGRATAEILCDHGLDVVLVCDAAAAHVAERCDRVLVGVDSFLGDGSVVNKMGTSLIALAARARGIPLHAVGTSYKCRLDPEPLVLEEGDAGHLVQGLARVKGWNVLFDRTPAELVAERVSERGDPASPGVAARIEALRRIFLDVLEGE